MKLKQERSIIKLEAVITEIELNARADASEQDIKLGNKRSYDDFSNDVKQWLKTRISNNHYVFCRTCIF